MDMHPDMTAPNPLRRITTRDDAGTTHAVDPEILRPAFRAWARQLPPLNYSGLGYEIERRMPAPWSGHWAFARAADRVVQNLRKAGWIEKIEKGRGWQLTDRGRAERDSIPNDRTG